MLFKRRNGLRPFGLLSGRYPYPPYFPSQIYQETRRGCSICLAAKLENPAKRSPNNVLARSDPVPTMWEWRVFFPVKDCGDSVQRVGKLVGINNVDIRSPHERREDEYIVCTPDIGTKFRGSKVGKKKKEKKEKKENQEKQDKPEEDGDEVEVKEVQKISEGKSQLLTKKRVNNSSMSIQLSSDVALQVTNALKGNNRVSIDKRRWNILTPFGESSPALEIAVCTITRGRPSERCPEHWVSVCFEGRDSNATDSCGAKIIDSLQRNLSVSTSSLHIGSYGSWVAHLATHR